MTLRVFCRENLSIGWLILALLFAVAQLQLVIVTYQEALADSFKAAKGVYDGTPHWLIYQSRVLGPYLIVWITKIVGDPAKAFVLFFISAQTLAGYLAAKFAPFIVGKAQQLGIFFTFQSLFSVLVIPHRVGSWLYVWDLIGLNIFLVFIYFVVTRKGWKSFLILFLLAVLNRESALFIALWMVLNPLCRFFLKDSEDIDWPMIGSGILSLISGGLLIKYLRSALLVKELGPEMFNSPDLAGKFIHFKLSENIEFIKSAFLGFGENMDIVIPVFILSFIFLGFSLAIRFPRRFMALALINAALIGSLLFFAVVYEVRIYLELIPFMAFGIFIFFVGPSEGDDYLAKDPV